MVAAEAVEQIPLISQAILQAFSTESIYRQPFYVYIYLNKQEVSEIKQEEEFQDIIEVAEENTGYDDEIEDILKDKELIQSIFSDDDPADMSDLEKQEKGFE